MACRAVGSGDSRPGRTGRLRLAGQPSVLLDAESWSAEDPGRCAVGRGLSLTDHLRQSSGHSMGFQFQALSPPEAQHHLPGVDSSNALFLHNKFSLFRSFSSLTGSLILAIKTMLMKKMLCSNLDCLSPLGWFITHSQDTAWTPQSRKKGNRPARLLFP